MRQISIIEDPRAAEVSLDPLRGRILAELTEPGSASSVAAALDLPRQKVNYHLKTLEAVGLVEQVAERKKGGLTEKLFQSTAGHFLISPQALDTLSPDPEKFSDRFSALWLLALGGRLVREVGKLLIGSAAANKPVATFAIDAELTFANASDRAAFAQELGTTIDQLVARYHAGDATGARRHRVVVGLHPSLTRTSTKDGQ